MNQAAAEQVEGLVVSNWKYKAFISYSHHDKFWGKWLHRKLESFRVPRAFVDQMTHSGNVPKRLAPIFRDFEELPTSSDLSKAIQEALEQSQFLIVVCSPHAASSNWVNEEVLAFKRMGRADRVLALIVDGEPHATDKTGSDPSLECFPPALRFQVHSDGSLSDSGTEPFAPSLKEMDADYAKLKLIAGILGVGFDELYQRDRRARRRRMAFILGVSALILLVILGSLLWGWRSQWVATEQRLNAQMHQFKADQVTAAAEKLWGDFQKEEVDTLSRHVEFLDGQYKEVKAMVSYGAGNVDPSDLQMAGYQLATANAKLAWVNASHEDSIEALEEAAGFAEKFFEIKRMMVLAGVAHHDELYRAESQQRDARLMLSRSRRILSQILSQAADEETVESPPVPSLSEEPGMAPLPPGAADWPPAPASPAPSPNEPAVISPKVTSDPPPMPAPAEIGDEH